MDKKKNSVPATTVPTTPQEQPMDLKRYEDIIDTYTKNADIRIIINNNFNGLARTDVSNLEKPSLEINLKMMMEQFHLTADEVLFIVFHEVEHLIETAQLKNKPEGEEMEKKQQNKLKERGKHAMTYHKLANVIRDLFVNDEVVSFRKAPVLYQTRQKLFSEKTHNDKDLTSLPKHLQLINAINRERVIAYDKCIVDPDVRKIIDMLMKKGFLSGKSVIEPAITGKYLKGGQYDSDLGGRLTYMWKKIEPIYKKLFEEDMKKAKQQKNDQNQQNEGQDQNSDQQDANQKQQEEIDKLMEKLKQENKNKKQQQNKENGDNGDSQQEKIDEVMKKLEQEKNKQENENKKDVDQSKETEQDNSPDKKKTEKNDKEQKKDGKESDKNKKEQSNEKSDKEGDEKSEQEKKKETDDKDKADETEEKESDQEGKESDQEGKESDQEGKESDQEGKESDQEGKESDQEGKESDQEGKESDQEGKESDQEGKESDQEGKESDQEGKESDQEGKESDNKQESTPQQPENESESNQSGVPNDHKRDIDRTKENPFEPYYERQEGELEEILKKSLTQKQIDELVDKVTEELQKHEQQEDKSDKEIQLEQRVENMGITKEDRRFEPTKEFLERYDNYLERLEKMRDADTGKNAIEMIMEIFQKIKSDRGKTKVKQIGPVDIENGIRLHGPKIAEGIADIMAGKYDPEMFQKDIKVEYNEHESVGEFDVTVICDGSGSMGGNKNREQKKAALLVLESLKRLHDKIEREAEIKREQKIKFNTDGKIFFGGEYVEILKPSHPDFTDEERLRTFQLLDNCPGDTNDYSALRETYDDITNKGDDYLQKIKRGEIKRIVLIITDGGSNDSSRLKKYIRELRNLGVLVYGIGIGDEYQDVIVNYNTGTDKKLGYGVPCEVAEKLPSTLLNILKPHLENL